MGTGSPMFRMNLDPDNRKARLNSLTDKGREQLLEKTSQWRRLTRAVDPILDATQRPQSEEV